MKKIICILMAVAMIAATCFVLTGCGDDKKTDPTKATVAATQPATQAVTNAPVQTVTEAPAQSVTAAPQATQGQDQPQSDVYGGITGTEAAEQALAYAGEGYQVVSNEQRYLRNQEAWYVGVQALVNDSTVYHIYINADEHVRTQIRALCEENGMTLVTGSSMESLGRLCGIDVGCAVCASLS